MPHTIKEPTTRNARTTFNSIVDAAIKLFYEKGYHGTTVNNITQKAGVAAGTFYLYFPSKLLLYKYLLTRFSHQIRSTIAAEVSKKTSRYDKEREGLKTFILLAKKNPHMYNIIWESLYIDRELFKDYYESFAIRYIRGLKSSIDSGEIRDVDTEITTYILMGISNFIGLKVVLDLSSNIPIDTLVDGVMDLLENGLFTKKA